MPTVLVTGAGRGIGRATATRLANAGWDVIAGVRAPEHGEALVAAGAGRIAPLLLDVTDEAHVSALDAALPARLDAVVNNAGVAMSAPVEALSLNDLRRQLEVNVVRPAGELVARGTSSAAAACAAPLDTWVSTVLIEMSTAPRRPPCRRSRARSGAGPRARAR
jgi:NAD(P)-dependent dehydrogenase (short-subunit alcohol dehydrogenase family)